MSARNAQWDLGGPQPTPTGAFTDAWRGLRRAVSAPQLVVSLWAVQALLALLVAVPVFARLRTRLGVSSEADGLLEGASLPLLFELMRAEPGLLSLTVAGLLAVGVVALLVNPWLAGGSIAVLNGAGGGLREAVAVGESGQANSVTGVFSPRFATAAAHFYGRFLRVGLVALATGLVAAGLLATPLLVLGKRAGAADLEVRAVAFRVSAVVIAGLVLVLVWLALDLARLRIAHDDRRDAVRSFWRCLRVALRYPVALVGRWILLASAFLVLVMLQGWASSSLDTTSWLGIVAVVLLQQLVALGRSGMRVALWETERRYLSRFLPVPSAADLHQTVEVAPVAVAQEVFGGLGADGSEDRGVEGFGVVEELPQRVVALGEKAEPQLAASGESQSIAVGAEGVGERRDETDGADGAGDSEGLGGTGTRRGADEPT